MAEEEIKKIDFNECLSENKIVTVPNHIEVENSTLNFKNINFNRFSLESKKISTSFKNEHSFNIEIDGDDFLKDIKAIMFINCKFNQGFHCNYSLKYDLIFMESIIQEVNFFLVKEKSINKVLFIGNIIKKLSIVESNLNKFEINSQDMGTQLFHIETVKIHNSTFSNNFSFYNSIVKDISIIDVDFEKNVRFIKSKFEKGIYSDDICFDNTNFKKLVILEKCEFKEKVILNNVTFEGVGQFRELEFKKGLDLDLVSSEKEMNFYDIRGLSNKKSIENTSQETYRILKYNCEKIGNIIESNKYHALELEKKKNNLSFYDLKNGIPFHINYVTSKFGTSWFTALRWILYVGFITNIWIHWDNFEFFLEHKYFLSMDILKYMSIIHLDELKKHPYIFIFNKVALGYLYYQFIIAVRKDTRK